MSQANFSAVPLQVPGSKRRLAEGGRRCGGKKGRFLEAATPAGMAGGEEGFYSLETYTTSYTCSGSKWLWKWEGGVSWKKNIAASI